VTEEIRKFLQQGAADHFLNKQAHWLVSAEPRKFCGSYYNPNWSMKFRAEHMQPAYVDIKVCYYYFFILYYIIFYFILAKDLRVKSGGYKIFKNLESPSIL